MTVARTGGTPNRGLIWSRSTRCRGLIALVLGWSGAGCSHDDGRLPVYRVAGQVSVGNQIPEGALVVLNPTGATPGEIRPSAKVQRDGTFELTTYETNDGAPVGDYVATIQWQQVTKQRGEYVTGPNLVPRAYAAEKTSPWKIKVAATSNTLPTMAIPR